MIVLRRIVALSVGVPLIGSKPTPCSTGGFGSAVTVGGRSVEVGRGGDQSVDSAED